jgi:hypothetical protein
MLKKLRSPRDRSLVFENGTSVEGIGVLAFVPRENRFPLFRIS